MTKQQKIHFKLWEETQSEPVPESLKNIFIDSCLEELQIDKNLIGLMCEKYKKQVVKIVQPEKGYNFIAFCHPDDITSSFENWHYTKFNRLPERIQTEYILFFLSRTPDGKAVMSFLDVETKEYKRISKQLYELKEAWEQNGKVERDKKALYECSDLLNRTICYLDHLLYREFTEALRIGKSFDQALEIITKTYLSNSKRLYLKPITI